MKATCSRCGVHVIHAVAMGGRPVTLEATATCYHVLTTRGVETPTALVSTAAHPVHTCLRDVDHMRRGLQLVIAHLHRRCPRDAMEAAKKALAPPEATAHTWVEEL